jgi:hypothetical protein
MLTPFNCYINYYTTKEKAKAAPDGTKEKGSSQFRREGKNFYIPRKKNFFFNKNWNIRKERAINNAK